MLSPAISRIISIPLFKDRFNILHIYLGISFFVLLKAIIMTIKKPLMKNIELKRIHQLKLY